MTCDDYLLAHLILTSVTLEISGGFPAKRTATRHSSSRLILGIKFFEPLLGQSHGGLGTAPLLHSPSQRRFGWNHCMSMLPCFSFKHQRTGKQVDHSQTMVSTKSALGGSTSPPKKSPCSPFQLLPFATSPKNAQRLRPSARVA